MIPAEPVEIVAYDPAWPGAFAAEAARIAPALAPHLLAIEHIGSTAVEGLASKPIVDMQAGVQTLAASAAIVAAMQALGYRYLSRYEAEPPFDRRRYFVRWVEGRRAFQVHLVERSNTDWWDRHLTFRDWLRRHPADRDAYAALKRLLAAQHRDDRDAYTVAKTEFIDGILRRAASA